MKRMRYLAGAAGLVCEQHIRLQYLHWHSRCLGAFHKTFCKDVSLSAGTATATSRHAPGG